jgi:predicted dehydrogenase
MSEKNCRWGILSTATIARKNWQSIFRSGNAVVTAVASRDQQKAARFIRECQHEYPFAQPPTALGSYEALLDNDQVDAVYIPLPTGLRKEWVIKAAEAGKHVLCEKPCAISAADLSEMIEACQSRNLQFMDGVMYMHSQRLQEIHRELHQDKVVGDIRRIACQFSFRAPDEFLTENIRSSGDLEPAGCLGDLGWYTIRYSLFAMDYQMPKKVCGRIHRSHARSGAAPVPMEFSAELLFDNGVTAGFYNSFLTEHQQWANVSGSRGNLQVNDFVLPFFGFPLHYDVYQAQFIASGCEFNMEGRVRRANVNEYSNSAFNAQESQMLRRFSDNVVNNKIDPHWPDIALKTQRVMDACLQSALQDGALVDV